MAPGHGGLRTAAEPPGCCETPLRAKRRCGRVPIPGFQVFVGASADGGLPPPRRRSRHGRRRHRPALSHFPPGHAGSEPTVRAAIVFLTPKTRDLWPTSVRAPPAPPAPSTGRAAASLSAPSRRAPSPTAARRQGNADLRSAQPAAGGRTGRTPSSETGGSPLGRHPGVQHHPNGGLVHAFRCASRSCAGPHRENCPEVGVPLPARHSAWWRGADTCTIHHRPLRSPSSWNSQDHSTMHRALVSLPDDRGGAQVPSTARSRWCGVPSPSSTRSSSTPVKPRAASHSCTSRLPAWIGAVSPASRWNRVWW